MVNVIGVRFRNGSRTYYFDPLDITFEIGDGVIVETARGTEFGEVSSPNSEVEETEIVAPLKPVIRKATEEDGRMRAEYASREPEAFRICEEMIRDHGLDMKLVNVEYIFNGTKVIFYFTADERVDFRELVRDLASRFRTRIELRQIGVRDETKLLGGLGPCGRPVCCRTFLDEFRPVSIKMAKEQNLSLSPTKISGLCGRLMCCLQYEQAVYEETKKKMPKTGKEICCPAGQGIAIENNAITERTKVRLTLEDGTVEVREYPYTSLWKPGEEPVGVPEEPIPVRKEKPLPQTVAYVAPELPADAQPKRSGRDRSGTDRRDRDRGRDRNRSADDGAKPEERKPREGKTDSGSAEQPKNERRQRPPRRRGPSDRPKDGAPGQEGPSKKQEGSRSKPERQRSKAEQPARADAQEPAVNGEQKRRRRRSRHRRPQTEGGTQPPADREE